MQFSGYAVVFLLVAAVMLVVFRLGGRVKKANIMLSLAGLGVFMACVCMAISMVMTAHGPKLFFHELKFIGIATLPVFMFFFYLEIADRKIDNKRQLAIVMSVIPAVTIVSSLTNDFHHLFRTSAQTVSQDGQMVIELVSGPLFLLHSVYSYGILAAGIVILSVKYFKTPPLFRSQHTIIVATAILVVPINAISILGIVTDYGDIAVVAFALSFVLQYSSLMWYNPLIGKSRELVIGSIQDCILFFGAAGTLIDVNRKAKERFDLDGITDYQGFVKNCLGIGGELGAGRSELKLERGETFIADVTEFTDSKGRYNGRLVQLTDITTIKNAMAELEYAAEHDLPTGLYNRQALKNYRAEPPVNVIMFCIDDMKFINQVMGFAYGDRVIVAVAEALKKACPPGGFAARLGGDEFVLIVRSEENFEELIRERCAQSEGLLLPVGLTFGFGSRKTAGENMNIVLEAVTEELERGKLMRSGARLFEFVDGMLEKTRVRDPEFSMCAAELCVLIGKRMGCSERSQSRLEMLVRVYKAGLLDGTSAEPDKASVMRGRRIALMTPELTELADAVSAVYENFDGSGFPYGLSGEEIPLAARILRVVEEYLGRVGEGAVDERRAAEELAAMSAKQLDPDAVRILTEIYTNTCLKSLQRNPEKLDAAGFSDFGKQ